MACLCYTGYEASTCVTFTTRITLAAITSAASLVNSTSKSQWLLIDAQLLPCVQARQHNNNEVIDLMGAINYCLGGFRLAVAVTLSTCIGVAVDN